MNRRIIWTDYESTEGESQKDSYVDRLLKYIPADVVGVWLAVNPIIPDDELGWQWLVFVICLVFCFMWIKQQMITAQKKQIPWRQIYLTCGSFIVWVFAIGGPFEKMSFYQSWQASVVLIIYTAAIAYLPAPKSEQ